MTERPPLVSVLMTAYNREQYFASAIESVLAQTFRDFELLVVDDRSTDGTVGIAETFAARDARVRVVRNERNLGDYPNRNHAARLARGELLKFHDSDDVMYGHCLQVMVPLLQAYPEAGLAMSGRAAWPGGPVPMLLTPRLAYAREYLGSGAFMGGPASALFRRAAFEDAGGFPEIGAHSDHAMWLRFCARYPIVLVSADLFWYRTHAGQELSSPRAEREYATIHKYTWQALHAETCPLDGAELRQARLNTLQRLVRHLWRDVRQRKFSLALYRYRQSGIRIRDFVRYAGVPRRTSDAGTPATEAGPVWPTVPHE